MVFGSRIEIVVFSGAYGQAHHYTDILEAARSVFPGCVTHLLVPHEVATTTTDGWWAPYAPRASEILHQVLRGLEFAEAVDAAEKWTYHADLGRMPAILAAVPHLQTGWQRIYVGVSNGAIPAAAAALHFKDASGLWFASGVVDPSQLSELKALDCTIAVSAATREHYWGGFRGVLHPWASLASTHVFDGKHAWETLAVAVEVFSQLASSHREKDDSNKNNNED